MEGVGLIRRRRATVSVALPVIMRSHYGSPGGDGRMWTHITGELGHVGARLHHLDPARRGLRRRPDVWLTSGHGGAVDVEEPLVIQLHEAPWLEPEEQHDLDPAFRARFVELGQAAADRAAAVITPSEFARRQVIEAHGADPAKVHAVAHGVDGSVFHPGAASRGRHLVDRAGCSAPYVAFVSTVHPRKNLPALKAAMTILGRRGIPHGLVMVISPAADRADSGELLRRAEQPVADLPGGTVVLRDLSEPDLAGVLAAADVVCVPSRSEGFGLVALEAMASGTPVVAARRGALPEVVGTAGVLAEPDPCDLAAALERVIGDASLADHLRQAGIERSRELTWAASASGWLRILREVAG